MATINIPDVCERDIDLLLLEEFVASTDFCTWFLSQTGVEDVLSLSDACRSVKTANGESDLELIFQGHAGKVKVLIENKVYASFTPNQPQRYGERAGKYTGSGEYQKVITVIMAPKVYFGDETECYEFDTKVTYENLRDWLLDEKRKSPRTEYKLALLRIAIERGRSGWQLVPHPKVSQFWQLYYQLAKKIAPQLSMPEPKEEIPAGSHFIVFHPAALPPDVKLKHKVGYGHVDLEFREMGNQLQEADRMYGAILPTGATIKKAAKSAVIRVQVEPVDMTSADFASVEGVMRNGIETAVLLLDWFKKTIHQQTQKNNLTKICA